MSNYPDDEDPLGCISYSPEDDQGKYFICTLDRDHAGRHEGHGVVPLRVWGDEGPVRTVSGHTCEYCEDDE